MSENRLAYLFQCYFDGTATEKEKDELMGLLRQSGNDEQVKFLLADAWHGLSADQNFFTGEQSKKMLQKVLQGDVAQEGADATGARKGLFRLRWFGLPRAAAAAAIILLAGGGAYLFFHRRPVKDIVRVTTEATAPAASHDVQPGGNKATLTLADGSIISLDSLQNGNLTRQGNATIAKTNNGLLTYNTVSKSPSELLYNIISTPAGGQYQLVLSDGSKVWLNASSSLRFPTTFDGKERSVEITGEAYFEIKRNAAMPFRVKVRGATVDVLGTNFNVMAYNDEKAIKTTLLEGAVRFSKGNSSSRLQPGQEAALNEATSAITVKEADVDGAVAWKNGLFQFNSDDVETIMRQLGRWYNVETGYEGKVPGWRFTGTIGRNIPLSEVLKMLEVNDFHFRIEGKKIIVL